MDILTISEARRDLDSVFDRVVTDRAPIMIKPPRGEAGVMVSQSEWDWIEQKVGKVTPAGGNKG